MSVFLSMGSWNITSFLLLQTTAAKAFLNEFLLDICLGIKLLGCWVYECTIQTKIFKLFFSVVEPINTSPNNVKEILFSTSSTTLGIVRLIFCHSAGCKMGSHFGLDFHFTDYLWSISPYVYWLYEYLLWDAIHVFCLFFCCIVYFYLICISSLYILDNNYLLQVSPLKTKINLF